MGPARDADDEQLRALAGSAFAVGRITETKEALSALLARGPDPESQVRLQLIEAAATAGSGGAAVGAARLRLASDPKDVAALWVLAVASGRTPAGLAHLEAILAIYPDFVPAKRHLVLHLYQDPSQDARTLQLGTQARELLRTDMELNRALGLVVFRSGDFRRALGLLESSTDGYPKDAELWYYVGRCYQEVKQNTPAVESLQRALALGLQGAPAEDAKARLAALGAPLER
jgi:tetratricopeptide (TPR) repeat protein